MAKYAKNMGLSYTFVSRQGFQVLTNVPWMPCLSGPTVCVDIDYGTVADPNENDYNCGYYKDHPDDCGADFDSSNGNISKSSFKRAETVTKT